MIDWRDRCGNKLVAVEKAVGIVESGNRVAFSTEVGGGPMLLTEALAARLGEVKNVEIEVCATSLDPGWFDAGWEDSFRVVPQASVDGGAARYPVEERRADFNPRLFSLWGKAHDEGRPGAKEIDVFMVVVSPPDEHGYCSFGADLWSKKWYARTAGIVIAEVDATLIRTYGENFIHVSEIDYFVETYYQQSPSETPESRQWVKQMLAEPVPEYVKAIGHHIGTLVRDGDTLCIGVGKIGHALCGLGIFDDRQDLGYYGENMARGIVKLVRDGVITGKRKTLHPGKVVCNNLNSGVHEDLAFVANNPMFELYPQDYITNIRNIAAHDNIVVINSALSIDLTGQIASESIGHRMYTGSGGQPDFAIGAMQAKGGRSITILPSTARGGQTSRIVPALEPGTIVTVPRNFADYIVSEYGIASLHGKTQRERADELIAIAHPDFRSELKKAARKLYWP
ncbi:MAG: acetyl-CoA hydrolase/transferase C-terminal domain-containing protein [Desulfobacterales bacterium]